MESKAEELILHILPRVLRISVVVHLAKPKSVTPLLSQLINLGKSVVNHISK